MKKYLFAGIIVLLFLPMLIGQPTETTIEFNFQMKVDTLLFEKGISNIHLRMIQPNAAPGNSIRQIKESEFADDTMKISISLPITTWDKDTLAFDLINTTTKMTMKVVLVSLDYEYFYTFNLKDFSKEKGLLSVMYFDMGEIEELLNKSEENQINWKTCDIKKDINTSTISVEVNDFAKRGRDGLIFYSLEKIKENRFDNSYQNLKVEQFFKLEKGEYNSLFIVKSQKKSVIIAEYEYKPTRQDKKNKLFGHNAVYTFYDDYSFVIRESNPPQVVSLISSSLTGVGIWEVVGDEIHLVTPVHWYDFYEEMYLLMKIQSIPLPRMKCKIKGKKITFGESYTLKWKKVSGQKPLKQN